MTTKDDIERLFRTHYAAMYRLAMLILREDDVARDIVHDVFEALLVSGKSDVSAPYLLTAVRNRCLKHIRHLSVQDRMKEVHSINEMEIENEEWPDDDTIALIQYTVSKDLSDTCRRVVAMRFTDGKSYNEIAETLGVSKVAVYKHLRHAIDVLRKKLSKNGYNRPTS
ncbi:MAG: sigma-70 family RNA polymerase sigma factor [Bacteroides sp.]|nr:sigma-70 family RNA polymerase sigma factor [Bacteroides sp.]